MLHDERVLVLAGLLAATWLGVLTVVTLVLLREVAIHSVRLERSGSRTMPAGVDGIEIGADLPDSFLATVPEARKSLAYVLLMSAICAPCRELAPQLAKLRLTEPVVALIPGRAEMAQSLSGMLPAFIRAVRDPDATRLADAIGVRATPFLIQAEFGRVTGKAFVRSSTEFMQLVSDRRTRGRSPLLEIRGIAANVD